MATPPTAERPAGRTLLGVAGWPVGHSRSPAMHNAALAELGRVDWLYVPLPLPPGLFGATVPALAASRFVGINVTVPHKRAAHALATVRSEAAAAIGAANTLTFGDGEISADNTDGEGFLDALGSPAAGKRALVLGAGGSARAVLWALRRAGAAEVALWNRTPQRSVELAAELGVEVVRRPGPCDLLVNCTSVGLDPSTTVEETLEALCLDGLEPPGTVVDLVYGDRPTPLAQWAGARGGRLVDGLSILVAQGARSLEAWTGHPAPREVMARAARAHKPALL